jgi:hypothetical protein
VTFGAEPWKDLEIVLTDKRTELTMQVADEQGNTTRDYVALVFSTDKARWSPNGSRYVRPYVPPPIAAGGSPAFGAVLNSSDAVVAVTPGGSNARPDTLNGMPPGDYYVVALDDIDGDSVRDLDVLEQLSRRAARMALADGAPAQINLRRTKLAAIVSAR